MKTRLIRLMALSLALFIFCPVLVAESEGAKKSTEQVDKKSKKKSSKKKSSKNSSKKSSKKKSSKKSSKKSDAAKASTPKSATSVEAESYMLPSAELTLGFMTRDSETQGIGDLLIPLWNPGGTGLLFVNPRGAVTDHDAEEVNLGLGYRQLLPDQNIILGANVFYDYRDTGHSNYDQWGVGIEMLSTWIDARANYYHPEDKTTVVDSYTESETSETVSGNSTWSDPYAEEHVILQDYTVTRTLTTLTSTRTFEQVEQAMVGYDWEIGVRLPLPIRPETMEARIFGGMYDFERDFSGDAKGWKARAELRILASLFLDGGVYENKDLTGSDWYAGARLSVPLDLTKISQGRNPFATAQGRLNGKTRTLQSRLTEMVIRDPQIRVEQSQFLENEALATDEVTRKKTITRQALTLMEDINFVDQDAPYSGDGTAENPYTRIQSGVDNAFGELNVYVHDASSVYEENVTLTDGINLYGSYFLVQGMDGKTFGSGIAPIVDGMSMGPAVSLANDTLTYGFDIRNTDTGSGPHMVDLPVLGLTDVSRVGLLGNDATGLMITENILSGYEIGALLTRQGDFDLTFVNNLMENNDVNGLQINARGNSGTFNVLIENSLFQNNGDNGAWIQADTYDSSMVTVIDSAFEGNAGNGLAIVQDDSLIAATLLSGILSENNAGHGLLVNAGGNNGIFDSLVQNSDFQNNGGDGASIQAVNFDRSMVEVTDSLFDSNGGNGLAIVQGDSLIAATLLSGLLSENNGGNGLQVNASGNSGTFDALVENSAFQNNGGDGANINADTFDTSIIEIIDSLFTDNAGNGLQVNASGSSGTFGALVENSSFQNNAGDGASINADTFDTSLIEVIDSLFFSDNGGNGLSILQQDSLVANALLSGITAENNVGNGLQIFQLGNEDSLVSILDSSADANGGDGLALAASGSSGTFGAWVENSTFLNNIGNGANINADTFDTSIIEITDSLFTDNADNGLSIAQVDTDMTIATVSGSTGSDNVGYGLGVSQSGGGVSLANISGSTANNNGMDGVVLSQTSDNISVGIIGLPEGLEDSIGALTAEFGLTLPPEVAALLSASGAVTANDNAGSGVTAVLSAPDGLALATLFDITANNNGAEGILSTVSSVNGIAATLGGSSQNWSEILQLTESIINPLLGVNLPLSIAATGQMQAIGNVGDGVNLTTVGSLASITAMAGIDATGNGGYGVLSVNVADDLSLSALARIEASENTAGGIEVATIGDQLAAISILADIQANENLGDGISATVTSVDGIAAFLTLSTDALRPLGPLLGNELLGIPLDIPGTTFGPVVASGNSGNGIGAAVNGEFVALALLLDTVTSENTLDGVNLSVDADLGLSIAAVLSSDFLYSLIPDEMGLPILAHDPIGPVEASSNGGAGISITQSAPESSISVLAGIEANNNIADSGIELMSHAVDGITLAALFDITANNNADQGIYANIVNDNGIAATIGGSSQNWAEILQLADNILVPLLGIDLPLTIDATGQMQTIGNAGTGVNLTTIGDMASITAMVGIEATDNGAYGVIAQNIADDLALTALARVDASDNAFGGISMTTMGDNLGAIGLLADVNASDNLGTGIDATVLSPNGFAALLTLSTDAIRPLADELGIDVPGTVFGQVTANGNDGSGIQAQISGFDAAIAVLLDTHTSGNAAMGVNLNIDSMNGMSLAAVASSDLLYDILPPLLGAPVIPYDPMGPVEASWNGGTGILINQGSADEAITLLAGIDASANGGNGIAANAQSTVGDALVLLLETETSSNMGGDGVQLGLNSQFGDTISALINVEAIGNNGAGITVNQASAMGDAYAFMASVNALANVAGGLNLTLTADQMAIAALTDITANNNLGTGAAITMMGGSDVALIAGSTALDDIEAAYPGSLGLLSMLPAGILTQGQVELNDNGGHGLDATLTSTAGNVLLDLNGVRARRDGDSGLNLNLMANGGDVIANLNNIRARNNDSYGILMYQTAGIGDIYANLTNVRGRNNVDDGIMLDQMAFNGSIYTGISNAQVNDNDAAGLRVNMTGTGVEAVLSLEDITAQGNVNSGITIDEAFTGSVEIRGEYLTSINNDGNGVRVRTDAAGAVIDFGGGALGSLGHSSFYGNGNRDMREAGPGNIMAENNWWGTDSPVGGQFAGSVDYTPYLAAPP